MLCVLQPYGYITAEAYTHTHSGRAARAGEVRCSGSAAGRSVGIAAAAAAAVDVVYACYVNINDPLWRTRPRVAKHSAGGRAFGLVY